MLICFFFCFSPLYKKNDLHIFSSVQLIRFWRHTKTHKNRMIENLIALEPGTKILSWSPVVPANAEFGCLERCLEG